MRSLFTGIFLFSIWLLMSGVYKPLIVGLGLASVVIVVVMVRRMENASDAGQLELRIKPFAALRYFYWLLEEIAKANWAVTKVILSPNMETNQHYFKVKASQKTDLGKAVFANSITLTPGTISVDTAKDGFWVHALNYSETVPDELADMDARVSRIEADA